MEHVIQFGISIDDDAIQKRVQEAGYNDILKQLVANCEKALSDNGYYKGYTRKNANWYSFAQDCIGNFLESHKEEVIEAAATKLAESYRRTKMFKDKMSSSMEEVDKEYNPTEFYR